MGGRRDDVWPQARPYCTDNNNTYNAKNMAAIVLELRPKFQELRAKDYYSHEEVLDILCEFAKSLYPQIAPERIREIVTENF